MKKLLVIILLLCTGQFAKAQGWGYWPTLVSNYTNCQIYAQMIIVDESDCSVHTFGAPPFSVPAQSTVPIVYAPTVLCSTCILAVRYDFGGCGEMIELSSPSCQSTLYHNIICDECKGGSVPIYSTAAYLPTLPVPGWDLVIWRDIP